MKKTEWILKAAPGTGEWKVRNMPDFSNNRIYPGAAFCLMAFTLLLPGAR